LRPFLHSFVPFATICNRGDYSYPYGSDYSFVLLAVAMARTVSKMNRTLRNYSYVRLAPLFVPLRDYSVPLAAQPLAHCATALRCVRLPQGPQILGRATATLAWHACAAPRGELRRARAAAAANPSHRASRTCICTPSEADQRCAAVHGTSLQQPRWA
jgi:hypothetical protein